MKLEDKRERSIQEYQRWLRKFTWSWFATLKVTSGVPSGTRARKMFDRWVSELRLAEGSAGFRWVRILETGPLGSTRHFHVLVGGLRNRMRHWEGKWNELGGNALISRFDPDQQGIFYLLKSMDERGDLDIDFDFSQPESAASTAVARKRAGDENAEESPTKLRVDDIDHETNPKDLRELFEEFGRVLEVGVVDVSITADRRSVYGFVIMAHRDADDAMEALDGREWRGRPIRVSMVGS